MKDIRSGVIWGSDVDGVLIFLGFDLIGPWLCRVFIFIKGKFFDGFFLFFFNIHLRPLILQNAMS